MAFCGDLHALIHVAALRRGDRLELDVVFHAAKAVHWREFVGGLEEYAHRELARLINRRRERSCTAVAHEREHRRQGPIQ